MSNTGNIILCGYSIQQWVNLTNVLANAGLQVDQAAELEAMLKERDYLLKKAPSVSAIPGDIDDRISVAVARGVADANTEALNENLELRAENAKLLRFLEAIQTASTEYECDGVF